MDDDSELDYSFIERSYEEEEEEERESRREQGLPPEMTEEEMWWLREWHKAGLRGERVYPWMSFATFQEHIRSHAPSMTEEEMRGRCQGGPETAAPWLIGACPCESDTDIG